MSNKEASGTLEVRVGGRAGRGCVRGGGGGRERSRCHACLAHKLPRRACNRRTHLPLVNQGRGARIGGNRGTVRGNEPTDGGARRSRVSEKGRVGRSRRRTCGQVSEVGAGEWAWPASRWPARAAGRRARLCSPGRSSETLAFPWRSRTSQVRKGIQCIGRLCVAGFAASGSPREAADKVVG